MTLSKPVRTAQLLALGLSVGMGIVFVYANIRSWEMEDAEAYWSAAMRLRHGLDLYVPVTVGADEIVAYRYAPWLAWLWVPLTFLPKIVVQVGWSALLLAGGALAVLPLARVRTVAAWCLLALLGSLLLRTASTGNVHTLMIAALVWGIPRRSGPLWIGLAASIKVAPILYALVYAGRREWWRMAMAVTTAAILWAPVLLYDLRGYPTDPGESFSLLSQIGLVPWLIVAGIGAGSVVGLARTRYVWVAGSVAVLAAVPRLALYDLTYLLVWRDRLRIEDGNPASLADREQLAT